MIFDIRVRTKGPSIGSPESEKYFATLIENLETILQKFLHSLQSTKNLKMFSKISLKISLNPTNFSD